MLNVRFLIEAFYASIWTIQKLVWEQKRRIDLHKTVWICDTLGEINKCVLPGVVLNSFSEQFWLKGLIVRPA